MGIEYATLVEKTEVEGVTRNLQAMGVSVKLSRRRRKRRKRRGKASLRGREKRRRRGEKESKWQRTRPLL